jgi:LytS/YehU family sensor histidine kinase
LLQPLVENAIHHGALARVDGGEVRVQTRRTSAGLVVVVEDDGPGIDPRRPEGLGLHLVRSRLAIECPDSTLKIESSAAGTRAIVELR